MKLLIADDEVPIRLGLLEGIPWGQFGIDQVFAAENGLEAWQYFQSKQPDVVIADIKMPGLDGLELSEKMRAVDPAVQILLLSGYAEFEYAQRAIRLGVFGYELKPVRIKQLTDRVTDMIQVRKKLLPQAPQHFKSETPRTNWVVQAVAYIYENYHQEMTMEQLANHFYKSPNHFSNVFKKEMGVSFTRFLNQVRVEESKKLLKQTELMAYEVSNLVGYRDYKYFNQVFRQIVGVSPSEYRNLEG